MAKADIKVRLIPDFSQFKKELNGIVNGAVKGNGGNGKKETEENTKEKKKSKESNNLLKKILIATGITAIAASLLAGIFQVFEPVLKLLGVVLALLFIPLIPIMKKVLIALGEFAKKAVKNVAGLLSGEISLSEFFENIFGDVGTLISDIGEIISPLLIEGFEALGNLIGSKAPEIAAFVTKSLFFLISLLGKVLNSFVKGIKDKIGTVPTILLGILTGALIAIGIAFGGWVVLLAVALIGLIVLIVKKIKKPFFKFVELIKNVWIKFIDNLKIKLTSIKDKIFTVWDNFVNGLKNAVKGIIDSIKNFFSFGKNKETSVGDAIIRPNGQIIRTDPRDTLIATKNPEDLVKGSSFNFSPTINIQGSINSQLDVRRVAEEIAIIGMDELSRRTGGLRI